MPSRDAPTAYVFRGDVSYRGAGAGLALGNEADSADIQNLADHVLRKESRRSSRFSSFTTEVRIARKFTSAEDDRYVRKVEVARLLRLEEVGLIRIITPDQAYSILQSAGKKLAKQAGDVRAAMQRNREILIEGRIPPDALSQIS